MQRLFEVTGGQTGGLESELSQFFSQGSDIKLRRCLVCGVNPTRI